MKRRNVSVCLEAPLKRCPTPGSVALCALAVAVAAMNTSAQQASGSAAAGRPWFEEVAERSGVRTATRVSDARLVRAPDALRHQACRTLAIELRRLGAPGIRLGDPFDALARRLGIPPITPAIVHQSDPAVAATLFIEFHGVIEDRLARGTPAEAAHALAVAAPMPYDDAVQLIAMARITSQRRPSGCAVPSLRKRADLKR